MNLCSPLNRRFLLHKAVEFVPIVPTVWLPNSRLWVIHVRCENVLLVNYLSHSYSTTRFNFLNFKQQKILYIFYISWKLHPQITNYDPLLRTNLQNSQKTSFCQNPNRVRRNHLNVGLCVLPPQHSLIAEMVVSCSVLWSRLYCEHHSDYSSFDLGNVSCTVREKQNEICSMWTLHYNSMIIQWTTNDTIDFNKAVTRSVGRPCVPLDSLCFEFKSDEERISWKSNRFIVDMYRTSERLFNFFF